MGLLYKVSDKELLEVRNRIFLERGVSALKKNGFEYDPFKTSWHGQYDTSIQGYIHQFSRLKKGRFLERLETYILKGERWIQIHLNVFEVQPELEALSQLSKYEGIKFGTPPNNRSKMRLRIDDYKGMPLFRTKEHKIGKYYSKSGFNKEVLKLGDLIEQDLTNIDSFVKRWHELHEPNVVDWEGNVKK